MYPDNFRYTKEHEWVLADGAGVGIGEHLLVFLRIAEIVWIHDLFRSFVKRGFHRHRIHWQVADHNFNACPRNRLLCWKVTQSDVLVEGRRRAATGDPTEIGRATGR